MFHWGSIRGCVAAILVASALSAYADDERDWARPAPATPDFALHKGVVGNALELFPLDADVRVDLQRANAVISGPMSARSLALLLGVSNPVFMVPGLIWGIWSAFNIHPPKPDPKWLVGSRPSRQRVGYCIRTAVAACDLRTPPPTEIAEAPLQEPAPAAEPLVNAPTAEPLVTAEAQAINPSN